ELVTFEVKEKAEAPLTPGVNFLSKPANIYAEPEMVARPVEKTVIVEKAPETTPAPQPVKEETVSEMQLFEKEETVAPQETTHKPFVQPGFEDDSMLDEVSEQKKRAAERIQKLRNLSFNMNNSADANNEFDAVPAYVRRNMELFGNTLTSVENFYSKYTVGKDENDQTHISTINTFLDGKKPD
ncbi:MAG: hypothetical protein KGO92_03300, partial [Bacteroidota bacterium]|nr:hypothetical protein [Bacteroidota bacterium]